jgi:hypothetical protein
MTGLNGLHRSAGFWPCFWIILALTTAVGTGGRNS